MDSHETKISKISNDLIDKALERMGTDGERT